jgi:uncharacterized protein (UPF0276 family)
MTLTGVSDSPLARSLLQQGRLIMDYLEVHGPHLAAARAQFPEFPMLLHNSLYHWSLAHPQALRVRRAARVTRDCLALSRSPWYSIHLGFSAVALDFGEIALARSEVLPAPLLFERACRNVAALQSLSDIPLLLENLDYNPGGAYESVCEPGFITQVLDVTGAGLLLDLAHARVSAAAFAIPVEDYLAQLPLDRVRQIHLNRPGMKDGRLYDTHEALDEEDYGLLEAVLKKCRPWAVTLEYNRDSATLQEQLVQVAALVKRMEQPISPAF